jgi:hypothetical protein
MSFIDVINAKIRNSEDCQKLEPVLKKKTKKNVKIELSAEEQNKIDEEYEAKLKADELNKHIQNRNEY